MKTPRYSDRLSPFRQLHHGEKMSCFSFDLNAFFCVSADLHNIKLIAPLSLFQAFLRSLFPVCSK